ncbi:MAG: thioredoxin family protein [Phycisphaerae bacterium]|nr:thioredoxin family protein [Phycisphaerae bacterium]
MPAVNSTMLPLGTECPPFELADYGVDGRGGGAKVSRADLEGAPACVVMFICNHCPFVKHINAQLAAFGRDLASRGVRVVAISSNDIETHPDDAPDKMAANAVENGFTFPYLYDGTQAVAKAFRAACTPDFYVFDRDLKLAYRGQLDDTRPNGGAPSTGRDLREAVEATLAGDASSIEQKPSIGCNIKWKAGNAPEYFGG